MIESSVPWPGRIWHAVDTTEAVAPVATDRRWTMLGTTMARAVTRQCPTWLGDHAQDIARVTVMTVMALARRAERDRALTSFCLHRMAHGALIAEIRRRKRGADVTLTTAADAGACGAAAPEATGHSDRSGSLEEIGCAIRASLRGAKRERRLAIALHLQGHSVREAARLLGWDVRKTENLVHRGLADLHQCLVATGLHSVSAERPTDVARLREAFASRPEGPHDHVDAGRVFDALYGDPSIGERYAVIDDLLSDPDTAEAWRVARNMAPVPMALRWTDRTSRHAWMPVAVAAAVVLAVVWQLTELERRVEAPVSRSATSGTITSVFVAREGADKGRAGAPLGRYRGGVQHIPPGGRGRDPRIGDH